MSASRTITIEHNGTTYYGEIMRIKSTSLGWEDHGNATLALAAATAEARGLHWDEALTP
jgi:hypothetical protein